jgi:agmatinase
MLEFDPADIGLKNGHIFALPHEFKDAELILLPVPWEVTVSYNAGTAQAPEAILEASSQLDLLDPFLENAYKYGIYMMPISEYWQQKNKQLRPKAAEYIHLLENGVEPADNATMQRNLEEINKVCEELRHWVFEETNKIISAGKLAALLGGDHSTPLGFIQALAQQHQNFAILQIDAHADLRNAYEGFTYSHASIMYNAIETKQVSKLVQVGIRDISPKEYELTQSHPKIKTFYDWDLNDKKMEGKSWKNIVDEIVGELPQKVYISFDIDGLQQMYCNNTGTPVAGGLTFDEAIYLIRKTVDSGKTIIGFDLNEVAPNAADSEWNANVGARVLYRLCNQMIKSNLCRV